jgi:hypothetical protein
VRFSVHARRVVVGVALKVALLPLLPRALCYIRFTAVSAAILVRYVNSLAKV